MITEETIDKFQTIAPDLDSDQPISSAGVFFQDGKVFPAKGRVLTKLNQVMPVFETTIIPNDFRYGAMPLRAWLDPTDAERIFILLWFGMVTLKNGVMAPVWDTGSEVVFEKTKSTLLTYTSLQTDVDNRVMAGAIMRYRDKFANEVYDPTGYWVFPQGGYVDKVAGVFLEGSPQSMVLVNPDDMTSKRWFIIPGDGKLNDMLFTDIQDTEVTTIPVGYHTVSIGGTSVSFDWIVCPGDGCRYYGGRKDQSKNKIYRYYSEWHCDTITCDGDIQWVGMILDEVFVVTTTESFFLSRMPGNPSGALEHDTAATAIGETYDGSESGRSIAVYGTSVYSVLGNEVVTIYGEDMPAGRILISQRAKFCCRYNNRLVLANVEDNGVTWDKSVYLSDVADYSNFADGSSEILNLLLTTEPITGLAVLGERLYVFKQHSISEIAYTGSSSNPFSLRENVFPFGGTNPVECNQKIYFFDEEDGISAFDGVQRQDISAPVRRQMGRFRRFSALTRGTGVVFTALPTDDIWSPGDIRSLYYCDGTWTEEEVCRAADITDTEKFVEIGGYVYHQKEGRGFEDTVDGFDQVRTRCVTLRRQFPDTPMRKVQEVTVIGMDHGKVKVSSQYGSITLSGTGADGRFTVCPNIPGTKIEVTIFFPDDVTDADCIDRVIIRHNIDGKPEGK